MVKPLLWQILESAEHLGTPGVPPALPSLCLRLETLTDGFHLLRWTAHRVALKLTQQVLPLGKAGGGSRRVTGTWGRNASTIFRVPLLSDPGNAL